MKIPVREQLLFAIPITLSLITISQAYAETVTVPNQNEARSGTGAGLSVPFNGNNFRWQQIYMRPEFDKASGDVLEISALRFRVDEERPIGSSFQTTIPGLNIFMSTTSRTFDSASTMFSANIEGLLFEVLPTIDLTVSGSRSSATSFDVVIPLPNRFQYDRRLGNLLVDIRAPAGSGLPFLDQQDVGPSATYSLGGAIDSPVGMKTMQGLVTQFEFTVVPEPTVIVTLCFGSLMLLITSLGRKPHR